jgi:hypothetical protein
MERAAREERKPELGAVKGPLYDSERLRLVAAPPHPDLLPARGEKESACVRGYAPIPIEPSYAGTAAAVRHSRAAIASSISA